MPNWLSRQSVQATVNNLLIEDPGIFSDVNRNLVQTNRTTTDVPQSSSTETTSHFRNMNNICLSLESFVLISSDYL